MKNQFVKDLREGDNVNDVFIAVRNDLRTKQDGGKFLGMVFRDRSGEIGGIMWNNALEASRQFQVGDVVQVRGRVNLYQGRHQMVVEYLAPLMDGQYDINDLVYTPEHTQDDYQQLRAHLNTVQNPWLKQLLDAFLNDGKFVEEFLAAAAAKKWHHEYRGGLLRHCLEMMEIAQPICNLFPEIDKDLLLAAIFLHDIGKLQEMTHDLYSDYTTEGKLLGHIQIGSDITQEKISAIDGFPPKLRMELLHCILSHHGELAYGASVVPKTLEAIVLHHIDNLDAQTAAFSRIIRETRDRGQEWSEYMPLIERVIWTKGELNS